MPIFGSRKPPVSSAQPPSPQPASRAAPPGPTAPGRSYLGPGCVLEGEVRGGGSLECRGTLSGTVVLDGEIVIGEGGVATARLSARRILINGRLDGDAVGSERVEVGPAGHVEGDVRAPAVNFAEGAFFEGNVEMRAPEPDAPAAAAEEGAGAGVGQAPAGTRG